MATNWNAILSNTSNLNDVLTILKKVLGQLDVKADFTTVEDAIKTINNLDSDVQEKLGTLAEELTNFSQEKTDALDSLNLAKEEILTQVNNITTVNSINDLNTIEKWDGRTVYVKDVANFKYDLTENRWLLAPNTSDAVIYGSRNQTEKNLEIRSVKDYGAYGDGIKRKLSEKFATLVEAKIVYPFATSLDNMLDGCAIQKAINESSEFGFVAHVPSGNYTHDGLVYSNKSKLRGAGSGSTKLTCVNKTVLNTVSVPNGGGTNWFTEWELSGLEITAEEKIAGQAGFNLDTCRGGLISDIKSSGLGIGWREKGCWNLMWFRIQVTDCLKIAEFLSATYAGIPNYRYGLYCSNNDVGIEIQEKGLACTNFVGGGIERTKSYGLKISGSENRSLKFINFNFEDNNLASNGFDIIVGDDAILNSGVPSLSLDSCQFTCPSSASKKAFDLNRGLGFSLKNSSFNGGYTAVADVSSNFGRFEAENITGVTNFCESETTGVFIPVGAKLTGAKHSCSVTLSYGTLRLIQTALINNILESRRSTESYNLFEISANGRIGWHEFNTELADTFLSKYAVKTLIVEGALQIGRYQSGNLPAATTSGDGAIAFDTSVGAMKISDGATWRVIPVRVGIPVSSTSSGRIGNYAVDDNYIYYYTGDGTNHKWRRIAVAAW